MQLDAALERVVNIFWLLRRGTPSDRGIPLTLKDVMELDPALVRLLLACDGAFLESMAEQSEEGRKSRTAAEVGSAARRR